MALEQSADLVAREREWIKSFVKFGAPFLSACAAVGNVAWENKAHTVTLGALDHGSDGGFQWRLDRLDSTNAKPRRIPQPYGLKDWCSSKGLDWKTVDAQVQFFLWELEAFYPDLADDFFNPSALTARGINDPIATMTANIMARYEVPAAATAHLQDRIDAARYCFANMKDLDTSPIATPTPPAVVTPPKPAPAPAPGAPKPAPQLAELMNTWRAAKAALAAAQKALDDELARRDSETAAAKKEIGNV